MCNSMIFYHIVFSVSRFCELLKAYSWITAYIRPCEIYGSFFFSNFTCVSFLSPLLISMGFNINTKRLPNWTKDHSLPEHVGATKGIVYALISAHKRANKTTTSFTNIDKLSFVRPHSEANKFINSDSQTELMSLWQWLLHRLCVFVVMLPPSCFKMSQKPELSAHVDTSYFHSNISNSGSEMGMTFFIPSRITTAIGLYSGGFVLNYVVILKNLSGRFPFQLRR